MSKVHSEKEPLFHITKREELPFWKSALIRAIAILIALIFVSVLSAILIGSNPFKMIASMFAGSFGSSRRFWKFLKDLAVLLGISLAVTPAFRMKFWNIGAEGQTLIGCLASVFCVMKLGGKIPNVPLVLIMLVTSVLIGALWGVIPAICKAIWGTNETLFTLMMNYIATGLVGYALMVWTPSGSSTLGMLPYGHMVQIGNQYLLIILLVAMLTIALSIYLGYTKHGYEISVVGESPRTALYIGINVKKVIIRTMALSGALCGLIGFFIVAGLDHSVTKASVGGQGFTAIMVSWLAKFNPAIMVLTSALISFLRCGASQISTDFDIDSAFPNIIVGIIIFFIIGCEFFIYYKINFRKSGKEAK